MDSYLVRIYRRDKKNPEGITGTVEKIGTEKSHGFKSLEELGGIITGKRQGKNEAKESGHGKISLD